MASRSRPVAAAAAWAAAAALAAVLLTVVVARALDGTPDVDGEFVLVEPGVYDQPVDELNIDTVGRLVPDVPLLATDGREVDLAEYSGEPIVINLWFSNCAPCRRELKDFAEVHAEVGDRVQFVGVDPFDTVDAMERFASERGVTYDLLRDPERTFVNELEVVAFPVTLFVDGDGRILRQTGELDADELRSAIAELF